MNRRAICLAAAASLMAGNISRSVAQEAIPTRGDLIDVFKDVRRVNLLLLNIDFLYSALFYHIFLQSDLSSLQELYQKLKFDDIDKNRSEFFSLYSNFLDANLSQIVINSLSQDDRLDDVVKKAGEAAAGPAQRAVEFLVKAGVSPPSGSIISMIEFSQVVAVVNGDAGDVPIMCRYFPFSYFC